MSDPSPLRECLCFSARLAARRLTAFYEARLRPHGLTIAQFGALVETGRLKAPAMQELATLMALDPSTLSRKLRPLEEAGLVDIAADAGNGRVRRVRLTPAGKARLRAAAGAWRQAQQEAAATVPQSALSDVVAATERLCP
jgi:DNA-binding MarR family transcriptional regulator